MTVDVVQLLLVWEYVPSHHAEKYGLRHEIALVFRCEAHEGSEPRLPEIPDENQIDAHWVQLEDLPYMPLLPQVGEHLFAILHATQQEDIFYQGLM